LKSKAKKLIITNTRSGPKNALIRWDTLLGGYTKGQVKWSVWMSHIYWCPIVMIQDMCAREREGERECAHITVRGANPNPS